VRKTRRFSIGGELQLVFLQMIWPSRETRKEGEDGREQRKAFEKLPCLGYACWTWSGQWSYIAIRVRNCFQAATISLDTLAMALVTRAQKSKCALILYAFVNSITWRPRPLFTWINLWIIFNCKILVKYLCKTFAENY